MPDLGQLFSEVKSLPDEVLQKELSEPTGMIPGFLALGELQDRKAVRGSGTGSEPQGKRPNMVQELLRDFKPEPMPPQQAPAPTQGFAAGGPISQMNPFISYIEGLQNPEVASASIQEGINQAFKGQPPLMPLQAPATPQPITPDRLGKPMAPGQLREPPQYSGGGIASLIR